MPQYSGIWTEQAVMQAVGAGNWANVPGVPTGVTGTVLGATSVSVAFTAPTFAGIPATITSYTVTSSPGGITASGASSPITVTGLTTGTPYTFTVTATNASGTSSPSAASSSVTPVQIDYIEDVFSTYLYTGTGSAQTITNGIDLAGDGGLVWIKGRNNGWNNILQDTNRGINSSLCTNNTDGAINPAGVYLTSFNSNGFSIGTNGSVNFNTNTYVSWTFREQAKFFDVVTYTGNGSARTIAHNLGSVPGFIIVKDTTNNGSAWAIYHTSLGNTKYLQFTTDPAGTSSGYWNNTTPTSTEFTVGTNGNVNQSGATYVAYLFASNAGGFGLSGSDNVISCGSFTTDGSGNATVSLGYEPQWLLVKANASGNDWYMYDNMRGLSYSNYVYLSPNLSAAEGNIAADYLVPTATGFQTKSFASSTTYIYIAIRRGPMKVPTSGTSVFNPAAETPSGSASYVMNSSSGFPVDMLLYKERNNVATPYLTNRLTNNYLQTASTAAEASYTYGYDLMQGVRGQFNATSQVDYAFRRAPSFFDEVCYTGTGSATTQTHNLGVAPELMIVKDRTYDWGSDSWAVYSSALGATKYLALSRNVGEQTSSSFWNDTAPTASVFTVGTIAYVNAGGDKYVAYLFATCAGVSKVGSYTGTGALLTVNCGFAAGARFVLIKRTDSTGDWYTYDSARGISSSNDPYLLMNSTAAEVTGTNYVDTTSVGFQVTAAAPAGLNASGGTYIFLAIA